MTRSPLWTKNFTIITVGSLISMMGNAVTKFALGRLIYDQTESTLLYSLFLFTSTFARVVVPLVAGPYLDRVSRRDTIIRVDLFYTVMFLVLSVLTTAQVFNYPLFLLIAIVLGCADSLYSVAYDSFYPELIAPGNFSKAYSIGSLIYPLANTVMVPVANMIYDSVGIPPLFYFCTVAFFATQWVERKIDVQEKHLLPGVQRPSRPGFFSGFKEGLAYLKGEKGLIAITAYFFINTLVSAFPETLQLPYFTEHPVYTVQMYSYLISANTIGRLIGGMVHYRFHFPTPWKYRLAICSYTITGLTSAFLLFVPYPVMLLFMLINGMIAVTSFNIRISGTQNHVPGHLRARFNSLFSVISTAGMLMGQLMAGALGEGMSIRAMLLIVESFNVAAAFAIMLPAKKHVKAVYNQDI